VLKGCKKRKQAKRFWSYVQKKQVNRIMMVHNFRKQRFLLTINAPTPSKGSYAGSGIRMILVSSPM